MSKYFPGDKRFTRDCEAAARKAQNAADLIRTKLMDAEEKEIERHRKVMAEISEKLDGIYKKVYRPVYDPLEEVAYSKAELRAKK